MSIALPNDFNDTKKFWQRMNQISRDVLALQQRLTAITKNVDTITHATVQTVIRETPATSMDIGGLTDTNIDPTDKVDNDVLAWDAATTKYILQSFAELQGEHHDLQGLGDDDHTQYLLADGSRDLAGDWNIADYKLNNIEVANFNITPTNASPVEGDFWWNAARGTFNVQTEIPDVIIQVGEEFQGKGINKTGDIIINGSAVYQISSEGGQPTMGLAKADSLATSVVPIGIATADVDDDAVGRVTLAGQVNDIDTDHLVAGALVYLSDTVGGGLTSTPPTHPSIRYLLGFCIVSDPTTGSIWVYQDNIDNDNFLNGTCRESMRVVVTEDTGTIIASLDRGNGGGGDLTLQFSDGFAIYDTTPAVEIELTAGQSDTIQMNYLYIPQSTKILTLSTSDFPYGTEHIKVATIGLFDAARTSDNGGASILQIHNDHQASSSGQGHNAHHGERMRKSEARYDDGVDGAATDQAYLELSASNSHWKSGSGIVYQLHRQVYPAKDQSVDDVVVIANDETTPFLESTNLFDDIITDSTGGNLGNNKYFNVIFWGVQNKEGEYCPIMVNKPLGQYTLVSAAITDSSGYDNLSIPREFNRDSSTAFYICRLTIQMGATWEIIDYVDMRGTTPSQISGGAGIGGTITSFFDSLFDIHNVDDATKQAVFDASGITTATTRTFIFPDADGTLALTSDIPVAGDFNHNDLANIDAGDVNHITDAQVAALHDIAVIDDTPYDAGTWDGNTDAATKNALRDKIETLGAGVSSLDDLSDVTLDTLGEGELLQSSSGTFINQTFTELDIPTKTYVDGLDHHTKYLDSEVDAIVLTHKNIAGAHHDKYTDEEAVNAIEAVGEAVAVDSDYLIYIDSGVLKKDTIADILALGGGGGTDYDPDLNIGSGNADWIHCIMEGDGTTTRSFYAIDKYHNVGSTNSFLSFGIPLATNRGGKSLYITAIRFRLDDADANDYIDATYLYGMTSAGAETGIEIDGTNRTSIGVHTFTFASATDVSSYQRVFTWFITSTSSANQLDISYIEVNYYYA